MIGSKPIYTRERGIQQMKMKKLLALLLALSLCMVCFTAFAEEAAEDEEEITAITNTVSYEGVEVSLADMGLVFLLPSDWVEVAAPENAQFAYASPDGAITMCGFLCSDFDTVAAGIDEQLQSGDIQPEVSEVTINDWYYILTATADNLTSYAYLDMTEENMFCFSFTAQDPELEAPAYIMEMLGSVTEAAAE